MWEGKAAGLAAIGQALCFYAFQHFVLMDLKGNMDTKSWISPSAPKVQKHFNQGFCFSNISGDGLLCDVDYALHIFVGLGLSTDCFGGGVLYLRWWHLSCLEDRPLTLCRLPWWLNSLRRRLQRYLSKNLPSSMGIGQRNLPDGYLLRSFCRVLKENLLDEISSVMKCSRWMIEISRHPL